MCLCHSALLVLSCSSTIVRGASGRTGLLLVVAVLACRQDLWDQPSCSFCFCGLGKWGDIDTGQLFCRFRSQVSELFLLTSWQTDRSAPPQEWSCSSLPEPLSHSSCCPRRVVSASYFRRKGWTTTQYPRQPSGPVSGFGEGACSPTLWVLFNLDFLSPKCDLLDFLPQPMQKTSLLLEPNQTHSTNPEPTLLNILSNLF